MQLLKSPFSNLDLDRCVFSRFVFFQDHGELCAVLHFAVELQNQIVRKVKVK